MEISRDFINLLLPQFGAHDGVQSSGFNGQLPLEVLFGDKGGQPGKMFEDILFELARSDKAEDYGPNGKEAPASVIISKDEPMPLGRQQLPEKEKDRPAAVTGTVLSETVFCTQRPLDVAAASDQKISETNVIQQDPAAFASRGTERGGDKFKTPEALTGSTDKISSGGKPAEPEGTDTQGENKQQKGETILKTAPEANTHTSTSTHSPSETGEAKNALSEALKEGRQISVKEAPLNDSSAKTDKQVTDYQDRFSNDRSGWPGSTAKHSSAGDGTKRTSGHQLDDKPSGALNISLKNEKAPPAAYTEGKINNTASKHAEATAWRKDAPHFREGQNADARVNSSDELDDTLRSLSQSGHRDITPGRGLRQNFPDRHEMQWEAREMPSGARESSVTRPSGRETKVENLGSRGGEFISERQGYDRVFMADPEKTVTETPPQRHGFSFKDLSAPSEALGKTLSPDETDKREFQATGEAQRQSVWTKQYTHDGEAVSVASKAGRPAHDKATGTEKAEVLHQSVGAHNVSPQKMTQENIPTAQIIERISARFIEIADKDGGRVKVSLSPPTLGNLEMDVMLRNGTLRVVLVVESKDVHQALTANMETLKGALQSHGLVIERCEVMLQDRPDHYWQGFSHQHAFERDQSGRRDDSSAGDPEYVIREVSPIAEQNINKTAREAGKISVFV
jgi:hypothetical protein